MTEPYTPRRRPQSLDLELRGLRCHLTRWAGTGPEPTRTNPIPVVDAVQLDVEALGLADKLGLAGDEDEVGPTS